MSTSEPEFEDLIVELVDDDVRQNGAVATEEHYQKRLAAADDGAYLKEALAYLRYEYEDDL